MDTLEKKLKKEGWKRLGDYTFDDYHGPNGMVFIQGRGEPTRYSLRKSFLKKYEEVQFEPMGDFTVRAYGRKPKSKNVRNYRPRR